MRMISMLALCGCVLLMDGPAVSQNVGPIECEDAVTQMEMTQCAVQDYEEADQALNAQWKRTKKTMAEWDADLEGDLKGAEQALVVAQRAWIAYRDAQCELEGFQARGGTLEPALVAGCLARLTIERTKDLQSLADGIGN